MKKSSYLIALLILVVSTLWIMSGRFSETDEIISDSNQKTEKIPQSVLVQEFLAEEFVNYLGVNGRSKASRSVVLKAEISAQIETIVREKGAVVEREEILVRFKKDDREFRVQEAIQRVHQRQIEYEAALKLKKEGFNSKVRVAESRAELESARATLERTKLDLDHIHIKAPFEGIIDRQYVEIGDFLGVGQDLLKIVDLDPIEFEVFVSEHDIQEIKQGQSATVFLIDGSQLEGLISYVSVSADDTSRTFPVEISVENKDFKLKEGMTVELKIPLPSKKAHKIPSSLLVLNDQGLVGVRSIDDQKKVMFNPIKILASEGGYNWISGLDQKMVLIIQGQEFVSDGQVVSPQFKKP